MIVETVNIWEEPISRKDANDLIHALQSTKKNEQKLNTYYIPENIGTPSTWKLATDNDQYHSKTIFFFYYFLRLI